MVLNMERRRAEMVECQLARRGISDRRVLDAMATVPREEFVPAELRERAYDDEPLPIGWGQTISQPYMVALMIEALALKGGERVLDVGTGSGYAAAVLARIAGEVWSIERIPELAATAGATLDALGCRNVHVIVGDGAAGREAAAPFDGILVSACSREVPDALREQLAIGGRLVIPVGQPDAHQRLVRLVRTGEDSYDETAEGMVRFVPLVSGTARG